MEALSREFRVGCPWELLFADDLVVVESVDELNQKLETWKNELENKGLGVNGRKTKVLRSCYEKSTRVENVKWPCAICLKEVGSNSIYCSSYSKWIHKRCFGMVGAIKKLPRYICGKCSGDIPRPIKAPEIAIKLGDEQLKKRH